MASPEDRALWSLRASEGDERGRVHDHAEDVPRLPGSLQGWQMTLSPDAEQEAAILHAEVLTSSLACHAAERELSELGITASPADVFAWLIASNRQRRELSLQWATYVSNGDPEWKGR